MIAGRTVDFVDVDEDSGDITIAFTDRSAVNVTVDEFNTVQMQEVGMFKPEPPSAVFHSNRKAPHGS